MFAVAFRYILNGKIVMGYKDQNIYLSTNKDALDEIIDIALKKAQKYFYTRNRFNYLRSSP
jgi:hypothetical protein